ncbi:MAG: redoxin domain-containing protein [Bacteroidales bacterium]|jgi:thiol-disulfide isomerase/thioredoxin|nr:redoxin domain-containing protein [Bacteroidales bacterium]
MSRTLIGYVIFIALVAANVFSTKASAQSVVDMKIKVDNYFNQPIVLGYYFDQKMLVKDTLVTNDKGVAHYQKDEPLQQGVYVIYFPERSYFDIMIGDDQTFELSCDTLPDMVSRVKVTGCTMLSDFVEYQNYLNARQKDIHALNEQYKLLKESQVAERDALKAKYDKIDSEIKERNEAVIAKNKNNFLSVFLTALKEVEMPDFQAESAETLPDSVLQRKRYDFYRAHWADNFNFADDRLLRTPFFIRKVDDFFEKGLLQVADTVANEAIRVIELARPNKEAFRYFVSHLYNMTNNSKIMGMDGALCTLAERYYLSGEADWADEKFIKDLREQVDGIKYTLIGQIAKDLNMISVTDEWFKLSEVDAPYTILAFWEPSCGHCKKEIPELKKKVWDRFASKGLKIYAVYCQVERKEWEDFITEHQLEEWMNVYDPYGRSGYRKYYHIKSTPQFFVLDKNKKIIAKRLGVDQIAEMLDYLFTHPDVKL